MSRALTDEQKRIAELHTLVNAISLAGAFVSMNAYFPNPEWVIASNCPIPLPGVTLTIEGYQMLERARIFLDGWNHRIYCSRAWERGK